MAVKEIPDFIFFQPLKKDYFLFTGMAMLDGHVYAIGGWDGSSRLDSVERYNPVLNTWSFIPPMKIALTSPAVVALKGHLYVTGMTLQK